ncbi:AMP-binding enzyme family protein (macronuclear) [Tetrahymena thermophila SB210]|uniref:AMP-binding enzyme family protein n=1 Tax=Tetrahymena thermophila (strain SB210) TaxID=312017 RepID=Q24D85_TETTS|nr:AMP-binding enzyme family protein [Tetrahymena thermophila SB210]EAS05760.4 AMP-binding enzyme family protein [Tetrahymena thermophila SB210]|eukprot:XP_001026005.4 AMP-binding enzyme family protein [Tetrahymena thermophila SB210]
MDFTQIDLFKQPFSFYFKNKNDKKGSFIGSFLSALIISSVLAYFIYQIKQYFDNQIDPKFRSQSFITNQQTQIDLHEDLISFKFTYNQSLTIDEYQALSNQTYLVYQAYFIQSYKQQTNFTQLNIIKCSNPQLSDYNCLDLSSIPQKTMLSNFQDRNYYSLMILVYGCNALDGFKTTIPSNCAQQTDIDNFLDSSYAEMSLKFYVTQYNITSQSSQVNYRNSIIYPASNQYSITTYKAEQQTTTVNKGFIIQSESVYSGPIQYNQESQTFNQPNNQNPYIELTLKMDEIIQVFQIQFPTFPEVLALVNSTFATLMTVGVFCKYFSQKLILQDFFLVFLQNMFQDTYEQILRNNKLFTSNKPHFQQTQIVKKQTTQKEYFEESIIDQPENTSIKNIPKFQTQIMKSQIQSKQVNNETQSFEIVQSQNKKERNNKFNFNNIQNQKQNTVVDQSIKQEESQTFFMQNLNQQSFTPFEQKPIQQKFYSSTGVNKEESEIIIDQNIYQSQNNASPNNLKSNYKNSQTIDKFSSFNPNSKNNFDYYTQKLKAISDVNILQKSRQIIQNSKNTCKSLLSKIRYLFRKNKYELSNSFSKFISDKIEKRMTQSLEIFELYKDILFIKKAIMLLLTKDQLATLKLVGYSSLFLQAQDSSQINQSKTEIKSKINYLEKQQNILDSEELQSKYILKFLKKCQSKQEINILDQRIFQCITGNKII